MKIIEFISNFLLVVIAVYFAIIIGGHILLKATKTQVVGKQHIISELACDNDNQDVNWEALILAIIEVESDGKANAIGANDDVGVLQITPVYVAECNAIIGVKGYFKLTDRTDSLKSIEMFNIYQSFHNPQRNVLKAIKLHNPNAPEAYTYAILSKYNELTNLKK